MSLEKYLLSIYITDDDLHQMIKRSSFVSQSKIAEFIVKVCKKKVVVLQV